MCLERQNGTVLDDNGILEYTKTYIPKPTTSNAQKMAQWKKDNAKSRRIILEGVKYHMVSNFHENEIDFEMWKNITHLFKRNSDAKKLALRDKLRNI